MNPVFATGYRHPRESGGPEPAPGLNRGATAVALPALDSRFCGDDENERQVVEISGFILGQALRMQPRASWAGAASTQDETGVTGIGGFLALPQVQRQPAG